MVAFFNHRNIEFYDEHNIKFVKKITKLCVQSVVCTTNKTEPCSSDTKTNTNHANLMRVPC